MANKHTSIFTRTTEDIEPHRPHMRICGVCKGPLTDDEILKAGREDRHEFHSCMAGFYEYIRCPDCPSDEKPMELIDQISGHGLGFIEACDAAKAGVWGVLWVSTDEFGCHTDHKTGTEEDYKQWVVNTLNDPFIQPRFEGFKRKYTPKHRKPQFESQAQEIPAEAQMRLF